jgi:hypothetical protein
LAQQYESCLSDVDEYEILSGDVEKEKLLRILIGEVFAHLTIAEVKERTQRKLLDENGMTFGLFMIFFYTSNNS